VHGNDCRERSGDRAQPGGQVQEPAAAVARRDRHARLMPPQVPPEGGHPLAGRAAGAKHRAGEPAGDGHEALAEQRRERFVEPPDVHADADSAQPAVRDVEGDTSLAHWTVPATPADPPATVTTAPAIQKNT